MVSVVILLKVKVVIWIFERADEQFGKLFRLCSGTKMQ